MYTGDIATIWPLFGMSNQLLSTCVLIVGPTMIIHMGKAKYAWVTAVSGILIVPVTMSAAYLNVMNNFLPKGLYLLTSLSIALMIMMALVFIDAFKKWYELLQIDIKIEPDYPAPALGKTKS